ncbi:MAG: phosphoribosylanthranilate isomerase [Oscillospiraceae bacterium]|nr:phosphoribosylanthranilate isomerase [Oscillospiraceae bacterium]
MSKIKICGLFRNCDIDYVNEAKPDYIGFILNFPKSHRNLAPERAAVLRRRLQPGIRAVGVFVDQPVETVSAAAETIGLDVLQLHGHENEDYIRALREESGLPVWKAFRVRSISDLTAAEQCTADRILLDNGYGTGSSFDWSFLTDFSRPFILAGGLTPENIPEAMRLFSPELLDISSGVETEKVKDRSKILAAVKAVRTNTKASAETVSADTIQTGKEGET